MSRNSLSARSLCDAPSGRCGQAQALAQQARRAPRESALGQESTVHTYASKLLRGRLTRTCQERGHQPARATDTTSTTALSGNSWGSPLTHHSKIGWSITEVPDHTRELYCQELDDSVIAVVSYERRGECKSSNNGLSTACECGRKIRVSHIAGGCANALRPLHESVCCSAQDFTVTL